MFSLATEIFHVNFIHVTMSTADLLLTVPVASVKPGIVRFRESVHLLRYALE